MAKRNPTQEGLRTPTRHRIVGQLLNAKTGRPLPRVIVHGLDLDATPKPADLGYDVADARGRFALTYTAPRRPPRKEVTGPRGRRLEFRILDRRRNEIYRTVSRASLEPGHVVEIRVPPPTRQEPPTASLRDLTTLLEKSVPSGTVTALVADLDQRGVRTLADVRRQGGLHHLEHLPVPVDDPALRLIDAYADLSALSSDLGLTTRLIDKGFPSVASIARASRADVVSAAKDRGGHFRAAQLHVMAKARVGFLNNVLTGLRADWANGFPVRMRGITNPHLPDWFRRTCDCDECLAAVSPLAYLVDLIDYALRHVRNDGNHVDVPFLTGTFHQQFDELPAACESLDTQVRQVRICIEVLRREGRPLRDADQRAYCMAVYRGLLTRLGTSYEELRLARIAEDDTRASLADRLGIPVDRLGRLILRPDRITEADLEDLFGLVDTTGNPLAQAGVPLLQTWRLDRLRSLWLEQDRPTDPYTDAFLPEAGRLPVIEPDLVGPDDFRQPIPKPGEGDPDGAFDIWRRRREWVDDRLRELADLSVNVNGQPVPDLAAMLARMYQPVEYPYANASIPPWTDTPVDQFETLLRSLTSSASDDMEVASSTLDRDLRLTVDAFIRLMGVRAKDQLWRAEVTGERVSEDEWGELRSILVQAQKRALSSTWREEESARGVPLGPRHFWKSLAEPEVGVWPPIPSQGRPWVDPDLRGLDDLPEPTAGRSARALWHLRREQIDDHRNGLRADRESGAADFDQLARTELGRTRDELTALKRDLDGGVPVDVERAQTTIASELHLTVESFNRLMEIRAKNDQRDPLRRPTLSEWAEVYTILTSARKEREWVSIWADEERAEGMDAEYWRAGKAALPRWRSSTEARIAWRRALDTRRAAPIIDPDVLADAGRLKDPLNGAAATLWTARGDWVGEQLASLRAHAAADGALTLGELDELLETTLGMPAPDLEALYQQEAGGLDVTARVDQLDLTVAAFRFTLRIRALVADPHPATPVLADEWDDLYSILAQVLKRRAFAEWREEERANELTLCPDHFRKPAPLPLEFPPSQPPPLLPWRATLRDLRDWDRTLEGRIDQRQSVIDSLRAAVSATEEVTLPVLRDGLIDRSIPGGQSMEVKGKTLGDRLLIDTRADGCQMTTRVAQAIETLQGLLWSLRTGQLDDTYPTLELDADDFDEEWAWIGSYATWRAAIFVFIYPENILLPSLRRWQTPAFRALVRDLRGARRLTPEQACRDAAAYYQYFEDVCNLTIEASRRARTRIRGGSACDSAVAVVHRRLTYLFARPADRSTVYWSSYDSKRSEGYAQSFWDRVPGLVTATEVVGTAVYEITAEERFLYLFTKVPGGEQKLLFSRYDLENQAWDGEPTELELPDGTLGFDAQVFDHSIERSPSLSLKVTTAQGTRYYERQLDAAGNAWAEGDWLPMDRLWGSWSTLPAPVGFTIRGDSDLEAVVDDNRVHVFVIGDDGRVYTTSSENLRGWSEWVQVGTPSVREGAGVLTAVSRAGRIDLLAVGQEAVLWNRRGADGRWTEEGAWVEILRPAGTDLEGATITAVAPADDEIRFFLVANTGQLFVDHPDVFVIYRSFARAPQSAEDWGWAGANLSQIVTSGSEVASVAANDGTTFLFVTNGRGEVWMDHWRPDGNGGGWAGWGDSPIRSTDDVFQQGTAVTATASATAAVDLFVVDGDGTVQNASSTTPAELLTWSEWSSVGDAAERTFTAGAAIGAVRRRNHLNLFAVGSDGLVYGSWASAGVHPRDWAPWYPIGGPDAPRCPADARPVAVRHHDGRRVVFLIADGGIETASSRAWPTHNAVTVAPPENNHPIVAAPFAIGPRNSEAELQTLSAQEEAAFDDNESSPASTLAYLEEAYYFVPLHIALQLQSAGQYVAALDWFRTVFDYRAPVDQRKIYSGLRRDGQAQREDEEPDVYRRAGDWLLDPLNPHAIAATRPGTYTRFTLLSLVRCFLEYADAEFTLDTAESVPRARILYQTALELLDSPELKQTPSDCGDAIAELGQEIGDGIDDARWRPAWNDITNALAGIEDRFRLLKVIEAVRNDMAGQGAAGVPLVERLQGARRRVEQEQNLAEAPRPIGVAVQEKAEALDRAYAALLARDHVAVAADRIGAAIGAEFLHAVSLASGEAPESLVRGAVDLPWLGRRLTNRSREDGFADEPVAIGAPIWDEYHSLTRFDPLASTGVGVLARIARGKPLMAVKAGGGNWAANSPEPLIGFCVPPNPVLKALRFQAELNLHKLRTCRNIAGMERQLEPYAAPADAVSGLPTIGAGGQLVLPGAVTLRPTPYRYVVLIERAKHLVQLAGQMEAAMLSALEKRDAEAYTVLRARQDRALGWAGVRLQDLRVREAESGVKLAELQRERAEIQLETYEAWINEGANGWEDAAIALMYASVALHLAASAASLAAWATPGAPAQAASSAAAGASTLASIFSTYASFERREQEWQLQRDLAEQDIRIGSQQVAMADDHVRVVGQERLIARMQAEHAGDTLDFLANKFTNVELYDWMSGVLERVYAFFLQHATATAQLAAIQLAFERQEAPPPFIQADYWEVHGDGIASASGEGRTADRRGLTGTARLLQDIYQLDQYAFETDKRKLQLSKTISLARLAPADFQRFRETGVMPFATTLEMFDRDFPGHYLRLIKRVRVSVIALTPPAQGIRATLSTVGASRVVVGGGGMFQTVVVRRDPESIALTAPRDATSQFELEPQPEMRLPFEGLGVETLWELRMPKAANAFDYRTMADVLVSLDYTARESFDYGRQVIQALSPNLSADRPFSFRHQFADQWYDLHNAEQTATPMTVRFRTVRDDFPANLEDLRIQNVFLHVAWAPGRSGPFSVRHLHFTEDGAAGVVGGGAMSPTGQFSTRTGTAGSWAAMIGRAPAGRWELALPDLAEVRALFANEWVDDVLLVITYSGRLPEWPM